MRVPEHITVGTHGSARLWWFGVLPTWTHHITVQRLDPLESYTHEHGGPVHTWRHRLTFVPSATTAAATPTRSKPTMADAWHRPGCSSGSCSATGPAAGTGSPTWCGAWNEPGAGCLLRRGLADLHVTGKQKRTAAANTSLATTQ
ncbi:hypothetical protein [Streptomyces sp. TS71-3]|uniref:hypothetical protein n=1 Tax=Streptomyces sp. TS71-3 TaxID=2733862 RepID=UPI001BB333D5|nr:hypothetical protein [Streptomyces sp. TS71-3]